MEHYSVDLVEDDVINCWVKAQFTEDLHEADLCIGMRPNVALLWSVKGEGLLEAAGIIIVLEGCCLRHLTFIQGRLMTYPWTHKWFPILNKILRLLYAGRLASNALFKTWNHV